MAWDVEVTDEFEQWWRDLSEEEQRSVAHGVFLLENNGPNLPHPYSSKILKSRHSWMRELRIQYQGRPYRVLYIFDSRRTAVLLLGGDKTGDDRWYEKNVPLADRIYDQFLEEMEWEN